MARRHRKHRMTKARRAAALRNLKKARAALRHKGYSKKRRSRKKRRKGYSKKRRHGGRKKRHGKRRRKGYSKKRHGKKRSKKRYRRLSKEEARAARIARGLAKSKRKGAVVVVAAPAHTAHQTAYMAELRKRAAAARANIPSYWAA